MGARFAGFIPRNKITILGHNSGSLIKSYLATPSDVASVSQEWASGSTKPDSKARRITTTFITADHDAQFRSTRNPTGRTMTSRTTTTTITTTATTTIILRFPGFSKQHNARTTMTT